MSQVTLSKVLKGLYSAAVAFLGTMAASLTGDESFTGITAQQWISISLATVVAFGGTYGLAGWSGPTVGSNQPPKG